MQSDYRYLMASGSKGFIEELIGLKADYEGRYTNLYNDRNLNRVHKYAVIDYMEKIYYINRDSDSYLNTLLYELKGVEEAVTQTIAEEINGLLV